MRSTSFSSPNFCDPQPWNMCPKQWIGIWLVEAMHFVSHPDTTPIGLDDWWIDSLSAPWHVAKASFFCVHPVTSQVLLILPGFCLMAPPSGWLHLKDQEIVIIIIMKNFSRPWSPWLKAPWTGATRTLAWIAHIHPHACIKTVTTTLYEAPA